MESLTEFNDQNQKKIKLENKNENDLKNEKVENSNRNLNENERETKKSNPKLGAFFHWGVYSIFAFIPQKETNKAFNGAEWYFKRLSTPTGYGKETKQYHEKYFGKKDYYTYIDVLESRVSNKVNPFKEWAQILKKQGVSYAIITAKHHDGVNIFPSKVSVSYFTKRDFLQEFKDAMEFEGISFGVYFSLMEWTPVGHNTKNTSKLQNYVDKVLHPQLWEILERYSPSILWTDGDWVATTTNWKSLLFLDKVYEKYPNLIINDRWGKNCKFKPHYKVRYNYKDRFIPKEKLSDVTWEHINSICSSWGYAEKEGISWKNSDDLTKLYNEVIEKNGTFCINFSPDSYGNLNQKEVEAFLGATFCE